MEDECFVPLSVLASFGWRIDVERGEAEVTAEAETFRVPVRRLGRGPHHPSAPGDG